MAEIEKVEKGEKVEYAQKIGDDGFYLKVDSESGEVVKKKTTPGPYIGIPIYTPKVEEVEEVEEEVPVEEVPPSKGGEKGVEKKAEVIPELALISLDDSIDKIVYLDQKGVDLFFEDEPGRFREIGEEDFRKLSKLNQERYRTSFEFNKRRVREEEHPEEFATPGIKVNPDLTSARARLRVEGGRPGFHQCWKAPHELTSAARLGYKVARYPGLKTFANEGDEIHKVSAFGEDELILTEVAEETQKSILRQVSEKSQRRVRNIEQASGRGITGPGVKAFDPRNSRPGLNWTSSGNPEE